MGAIVGGALGGVAAVALVAGGIVYFRRADRRPSNVDAIEGHKSYGTLEPYVPSPLRPREPQQDQPFSDTDACIADTSSCGATLPLSTSIPTPPAAPRSKALIAAQERARVTQTLTSLSESGHRSARYDSSYGVPETSTNETGIREEMANLRWEIQNLRSMRLEPPPIYQVDE